MKRLLIALAAAVAMLTASARVTDTQSFEESFSDFEPSAQNEDESELVAYDNDGPSFLAPYDFADFGSKYLSLDTGDATLWRTNAGDAAYLDMAMQFNPSAEAPDVDGDTKISVYLNSSSNLVVLAGPLDDNKPTVYETTSSLNPGTWGRITIASVTDGFKVFLNGTAIKTSDETSTFPSLTGNSTILAVGFSGSGKLDDFVARTTDPFYTGEYVASIGNGGEKYATLDAALEDAPTATFTLNADATTTKVLANRGDTFSIALNGHSLSGLTATGSLVPVASTSGDVTTYTADYFPRTATAGQDGTAANPYEVADVDDLQALSAAVAADAATFAGKCYVQTANIDMTSAGAFAGIGTYAKVPTSGTPFTGTYNGQGYTIANVTRAGGNTQGIFNQVGVGGVIENLVVSNMVFDAEVTGEYGFAIVGNAGGGATLRNLTAAGVFGAAYKASTHNMAGIVVRVCGGATAGVTTTIDSCTNNATIYGGYTKLGGICAIVQQQTGFTAGGVAFNNCANNGRLVCLRTAKDVTGNAGILGYSSAKNVELTACSNTGTIVNESGANTDKDGALVGCAYTGTKDTDTIFTVADNGGNSAQSSMKMVASISSRAEVTGFQYATVDNGVATTVTTLAKDTTYLLERDVAASETPVFTLAAAGDTFKVDTALGYTFAGTVAVDRTTLMPATSETDGTVTTYSATAGVASVDDVAYATFEDAVAAITGEPEKDDFVTLLADASTTISNAGTLKVKLNNHTFNATSPVEDIILSDSYNDDTDIATYTAVEGVAAVKDGNELPWVWYATFEQAYAAAAVTHYFPDIKVKVGADFVLPNVSRTINDFRTIEFIATTEAPIDISLANANYYMASTRYTFPANATLHIVSGSLDSISGGTLDVPAGATVLVNGYTVLNNISGLTGTGTLKLRDYTYESTGYTDVYYLTGTYNQKFNQLLRNANWQGTLELSGINAWDDWSLADIGNSGSTIRFNGLTTYLSGQYSQAVGTIELVGDGLTINGAKSGYTLFSIPSALKGNGALAVTTSGSQTTARFEGDVSGFTGDVTATGTGRIAFGSDQAGSAPVIYVHTGASVTNAATATWTCANFVVLGELVANGTVSATNPLYGNTTTGIYRANSTAAAITAADTWQGTYVVGWNPSEDGNKAFYINNYGSHVNATIQIDGDENGVFKCYPQGSKTYAPNVTAKIVLNANWTTGNGFSGDANATTFASLSGSGDFTVAYSGTNPIVYNITKLDGYTGTLGGQNGKFVIGQVNVATQPADGARVVKTNIGTYGSVSDNVPLYVAGVDTGKTLTYDASGAQGAGLYVAASAVDVTVPEQTGFTITLTANEEPVEGVSDGNGNLVYSVAPGAAVVVTYTAPNGSFVAGSTSTTKEINLGTVTEATAVAAGDVPTAATIIAKIGDDCYASLRAAVSAATAGATVTLAANDTVSFAEVVVTDRIPAGGSIVIDKNITIDGANYTVFGVSNAEILNATGAATPGYDMAADLVDGSNLMGFFVKSGNVTFKNVTLTEFGDTAYVNKFGYTPIQTASAYTGTLTLTGVNFNKFNRTAVCIRGGTLAMTGGTVAGGTVNKNNGDYFQQPVEIRGGSANIDGVTITGGNDVAGNGGGAIVAWGPATLTNVVVNFTGYGIWSDGPAVAIVGEATAIKATVNALFAEEGGTITVAAGAFEGTLAVDSDPASAISLTGGTFDRDVNAFCASGYEAKESAGVWTVSVKTSEPVTPGEDDGKTYDSAEDAAAAAAKVDIGATADVTTAVGAAGLDDYLAKFEGKVVDNGDGTYKVVVGLTAAAEAALADDATTNVMATVAASLPDIVADAAAEQTEVTVSNVVPGFYYSISYGTELGAMNTEGARVLAPASGSITLQTPPKAADATAGFYKVNVNVTNK